MGILVDYRCRGCGEVEERWTVSPPPADASCGHCGAESRRTWAPVGLAGRARPHPQAGSVPRPAVGRRRSMCSKYPQVPGLCHMSESAGRMWVARYLEDSRAVEREAERQEKQSAVKPPVMADAITHHHRQDATTTDGSQP